eukprot:jgi/Phyca11/104399/e_gw1.9.809.1
MDKNVQAELGCATILYANNLVFDPTSNLALEEFATGSHSLVHLIFTKNACGRHRTERRGKFCSIWELQQTISVRVTWSSRPQDVYWCTKKFTRRVCKMKFACYSHSYHDRHFIMAIQ